MSSARFTVPALVLVSLAGFSRAALADDLVGYRSIDRRTPVPEVADVSIPYRATAFCEAPCPPPCAPPACAPCPCDPDPCCRRMTWDLTVGAWISGLKGDVKVRGRDVDVDVPLSEIPDIVQYLEFIVNARLGLNVDRWRFELEGSYLRAGDGVDISESTGIDVSFTEEIYQPLVGYRVVDKRLGCNPCDPCATQFALMPYAGARYTRLSVDRDSLAGGNVSQSKDWWSPFVGVLASWDFRNRWTVEAGGDVGGFGVGDDFTWFASVGARYDFNDHVGMRFGWAFLQWNYSEGSGASEFQWNVLQQGPYLGVVFAW